jgi:hypothetical protein
LSKADLDTTDEPSICPALAGIKGLTPLNLRDIQSKLEQESPSRANLTFTVSPDCGSTCTYSSTEFSRIDGITPSASPAVACGASTLDGSTPVQSSAFSAAASCPTAYNTLLNSCSMLPEPVLNSCSMLPECPPPKRPVRRSSLPSQNLDTCLGVRRLSSASV